MEIKSSKALEILAYYLLLELLLVVVGISSYNYYHNESFMLESIFSTLAIFNFLLTLFIVLWLGKAQSFQSRLQVYKKSLCLIGDSLNIMGAVSVNTLQDSKFIDVNEGFIRMFGYSEEEVLGRTPSELKLWVNPQVQIIVQNIILSKKLIKNKEINFLTKSGKNLVGLLSAEIINIDGQECVLAVVGDITEQKLIQNEMARLDRLNIVGEMAAGIAHEVRNPMTTVRGFLQMLGEKKDIGAYKNYFDLMIEELDRANQIISQYLSITRSSNQQFSLVNLNDILLTLKPLIQADAIHAQKSIQLELSDILLVRVDENQIRQLILNLVRNGVEATPPGGVISIKTYSSEGKVIIAIKDAGKGIEPDVLLKLGTPFFTTKENGTGLGLATCYRIAAQHGAEIKCDTGPLGTTFLVEFNLTGN